MAAVRDLLHTRRLHDLTVSEIVEVAGISSPTFYAHFPSKYAAVIRLSEDLGDTISDLWSDFFAGDGPIDEAELTEVCLRSLRMWRSQGALFAAFVEGGHSDDSLLKVWGGVLARFSVKLLDRLARARPLRAGDLMMTEALIAAFERSLYLAVTSDETSLSGSDEELAATLARMWVRSLQPY